MTVPPETPGSDPLLDEAIAWIVRLKAGEPSRADVLEFQRWRGQSASHEAAFKRVAQINRNAGIVAGKLTSPTRAGRNAFQPSRRFVLGGGLAAAAAAGYAMVQPPLGMWPSLQELSADYRTAKGEQRKVQVTADVSLDLNTQTSIALRPGQSQPTVELISGEVLASAGRSPSASLVILAAGGRIAATGTTLNVQCIDSTVLVTCLNGAVDVQHSGQSTRIGKGQQVTYSRAGIGSSVNVDAAEVTAWQSGFLIFRDRSLVSVVEEVNRYRVGKIVIVSPELRRRSVNADFEIKKLDSFVTQVEQLFGARATTLPGGLVLLT